MRLLLTLLFVSILCTFVRAQVGGRVDAEYASWCMVDSIGVGQLVRFTRLVNIATLDVVDVDPIGGTAYTVAGTLLTCEAYDLREALREPLEDLYEDCQCNYTITQEDHRITVIRGDSTQNFDVEFQEVVRRTCAGQMASVVVHRDTLTKTTALSSNLRLQYLWTFSSAGQYVDQVNLRIYDDADRSNVISIDLNPATVQASYPALTLDSTNFEFDGSNAVAMAAAYDVVLNHVIGPNMVNTYEASAGTGGNVSIFTQTLHDPGFPYVTQPRPGDTDYSVISIPSNLVGLGDPGAGATTNTSNYVDQCSSIFTEEVGSYIYYDRLFPLALQPRLDPVTVLVEGNSNPTVFCDVSPSVCAELVVDPVEVAGCVETCSDVLNIAGHLPIADVDTTLAAQEFNSISIYVTQGPVGVTISGKRINYPSGWSTLWSAAPGKLLSNSFGLSAIGGEAVISFVR
jgi:hypothetical protein